MTHAHSVQKGYSTSAFPSQFTLHKSYQNILSFLLSYEVWHFCCWIQRKVSVLINTLWDSDARCLSKSVIRDHPQISAGYGGVIHIKKLWLGQRFQKKGCISCRAKCRGLGIPAGSLYWAWSIYTALVINNVLKSSWLMIIPSGWKLNSNH